MNIGKISLENEQFLNQYKKLGYSTKTEMANDALRLLRNLKAREARKHWRLDSLKEYSSLKPDFVWADLEGEDFA